jgi:MoxR-like ATPase
MNNPFADATEFEALRQAALGGKEPYERYVRRQAAVGRRRASNATTIHLDDRTWRMVEVGVASSRAVLLVGPPGTGKTEILSQVVAKIDAEPAQYGFASDGIDAAWATPEEEWSYETLVLGQTVVDGAIQSVEGELLQAIRQDKWLILDETNRADMDRVLGSVLTWLSFKSVKVGYEQAGNAVPVPVYLEWSDSPRSARVKVVSADGDLERIEYRAGTDWRLLGTYNAVDAQRVFRMGQALSRRFKHVPIPPVSVDGFRTITRDRVGDSDNADLLVERLARIYESHLKTEDAALGAGLFVDIPAYVERGLGVAAQAGADDVSSSPDAFLLEELLAEGYVVSVGNFLSHMEDETINQLWQQFRNRDAFRADDLDWIRSRLPAMRA